MLLIIFTALLAVYIYIKLSQPFKYWKEKGVPYAKPALIFGNFTASVFRRVAFPNLFKNLYDQFPNERYFGVHQFLKPTLMVKDPELIKKITIKDFENFPEHTTFISEDIDPLWGKNLFQLTGKRWREMRPTLSPVFTSSKMRIMFTLMSECADQFIQYFINLKERNTIELEMKDVFTRFTNDVIATTAFGLKCDSLKERNNEFYLMGKEATNFSGLRGLRFFSSSLFHPFILKLLKLKLFSEKTANFFRSIVLDTMRMREKEGIVRPDLLNLLIEARKGQLKYEEKQDVQETSFAVVTESDLGRNSTGKVILKDDDVVAQAVIFFIAGFDSAATLMNFIAYELAVNSDVQDKLYQEIEEVFKACNGNLTYEAISKIKYLDMVITETLRKWPPTPLLDRRCVKSYVIEPKNEGEKALRLDPGDTIWFPVYGLHMDPNYYPNPDKFDPERFSEENKSNLNPFAYIPFGSGPRNCIGSRFAILENKILFCHLIRNFEIVPIKRTHIPMVLDKAQFNMVSENGMWLGLKRRR